MKTASRSTANPRLRHAFRPRAGGANGRIRVVLADPQTIDRRGMAALLGAQPDFDVVAETCGVEDTVRQCTSLDPDVLVLSLGISGDRKDSLVAEIRERVPGIRILAVSERSTAGCWVLNPPSRMLNLPEHERICLASTDCLQIAATHGALGTIRRSAEPVQLFHAIRAVAAGSAWYEPRTAARLLDAGNGLDGDGVHQLSARELDVAALIAEGCSNKEISKTLGISEPTVKKHVGRILGKLGLADRLQAGLFVARNPLMLRRWGAAIA
jgi:DNA-binding NarL/FixJ family response regulator